MRAPPLIYLEQKNLQTNGLAHLPVVLCGDFNGKSAGRIYQHLAEKGFR